MAIQRDPTSEYQKEISRRIKKHYADNATGHGGPGGIGQSAFGMLSNTFGGLLPEIPVGKLFGSEWSIGIGPNMVNEAVHGATGEATNWLFNGIFGRDKRGVAAGHNEFDARIDQLLEKKGYLEFSFRDAVGGKPLKVVLPFFENPNISESRRANYAKNKIMNRSEPIRLWTGADPRVIKIDFYLTLPHLIDFAIWRNSGGIDSLVGQFMEQPAFNHYVINTVDSYGESTEDLKKMQNPDPNNPGPPPASQDEPTLFERGVAWATDGFGPSRTGYDQSKPYVKVKREPRDEQFLITYITALIDLIRSCVIGSVRTKQDSFVGQSGPPSVRLKFGTIYKNLSCIATNYDIKFDPTHGFHNASLLPRRLNISLTLESFHQSPASDTIGAAINPSEGWNTIFNMNGAKADEVPTVARTEHPEVNN